MSATPLSFPEAVAGLLAGDFTRLAPLFEPAADGSPGPMMEWIESGRFADEPEALAEAFSCACFNGVTPVVEALLARGMDPAGGARTWMNAFHWAANRGQLKVVELLIQWGAPLERLNGYGGTVLGCTVWSALHETRPEHLRIIEILLRAGANVNAAGYPTGNVAVDEVLRAHGAGSMTPP